MFGEKRKVYLILVTCFFLLLGIFRTFPLILHLKDHLPYNQVGNRVNDYNDTLQTYYHLWLLKDNLQEGRPLNSNPYEFSGYQTNPGHGFPLSLLFLLFSPLGAPTAYNLLVLATFALSGLGMYLLVELLTKNKAAGWVAGTLYCLSHFRMIELLAYGHIGGFLSLFLPFLIYALEKAFRENSLNSALSAGILIFLISLTEKYITYYTFLFGLIYIPFKLGELKRREDFTFSGKKFWRTSLILAIFGGLIIVQTISAKSGLQWLKGFSGWNKEQILAFSPPLGNLFNRNEDIYLGFFPLLLISSFLIYARKRVFRSPQVGLYLVILIGSIILSLGPRVPFFYELLLRILPYFNYLRSPSRIALFTAVALSVLSGFAVKEGHEQLRKRLPPGKISLVVIGMLIVIMADYSMFSPQRIGPLKENIGPLDEHNQVYALIRQKQGEEERLLEVPLTRADCPANSVYEYYITLHKKKVINGYSPRSYPKYEEMTEGLFPLNEGKIELAEYQRLKELKVKYIVVHPRLLSHFYRYYETNKVTPIPESDYLRFLKKDGEVVLFEVK